MIIRIRIIEEGQTTQWSKEQNYVRQELEFILKVPLLKHLEDGSHKNIYSSRMP
jgi:hypothetical protein